MKLRITVHGVAYDVDVEVLQANDELQRGQAALASHPAGAPAPVAAPPAGDQSAGRGVVAPIAGTVLELRVKAGDAVQANQVVAIVEAMKMKTEIAAPAAGTVARCAVAAGDAVREGQPLVEFQ